MDINERYGYLTVIKEIEKAILPCGQKNRVFLCKCDCGNYTKVRLLHLVRNRIKSCGCISGEKSGESKGSKLYNIWRGMKNRCSDNYFQNQYYKHKNITICDEWKNSYLTFKAWALSNGFIEGLQIDRIDNSKGYYPDNCRLTTQEINVNNRDNTFYVFYKGNKYALTALLREKGLLEHYAAIRSKIKRGKSVEYCIDTPVRMGKYYKK